MQRLLKVSCLLILSLCSVRAFSATDSSRAPGARDSLVAREFAEMFPEIHLSHLPIDERVTSRAWTNYLNALDYEHVFFTQADITRLRASEARLGEQLKLGDVRFAYEVYDLYLERLSNRCAYVDVLLDRGFDVNSQEQFTWKRGELPWPADETEWNEVWRKKIKNEFVQQMVVKSLASTNVAPTNAAAGDEAARDTEELRQRENALTPEAFIRKRYRRLQDVLADSDSDSVMQRYLSSFAQAYDPHSIYMSPTTAEDFDIEMKLSLVGIGALLRSEEGAALIDRIIPGGPASRDKREKRLRPGDRIVAVAQDKEESVDILHWPLAKVVKLIRGPKGTRVVLTVIPASDPAGATTKIVELIRDEVKLEEQAARARLESMKGKDGVARSLAAITLPSFYADMRPALQRTSESRSASEDVRRLLKDMQSRGARGVLLDLRNDGGGSLLEAVQMTGLFIRTGPVVQVQEGRNNIRVLRDNDPEIAYSGPLVILVDRRSASASEIVAGALQDYGRAIVVGDSKTHGKGTVQSMLDLARDPGLGSVKITTARYFRISGASTQIRGIASDIVVPSPFDYMEVGEEYLPNPMAWIQVPPVPFLSAGSPALYLPPLRENSQARRQKDERFVSYGRLLDRVQELSRTRSISLNLAERRRTAEMEKELTDLDDRLSPVEDGPSPSRDKADLVLEEGLKILADWVAVREQQPASPPKESGDMQTLSERLSEWFRGLF